MNIIKLYPSVWILSQDHIISYFSNARVLRRFTSQGKRVISASPTMLIRGERTSTHTRTADTVRLRLSDRIYGVHPRLRMSCSKRLSIFKLDYFSPPPSYETFRIQFNVWIKFAFFQWIFDIDLFENVYTRYYLSDRGEKTSWSLISRIIINYVTQGPYYGTLRTLQWTPSPT